MRCRLPLMLALPPAVPASAMLAAALLVSAVLASAPQASSQSRLVAYVPTAEASSSGVLLTAGDRSMLGEDSVVTALDHPAHVTLSRGGALLVCQASAIHLTAGQSVPDPGSRRSTESYDPLHIALSHGSLEIQMPMVLSDILLTQDMRFASAARNNKSAPLDLALTVSPNGDTCVENRGHKSPPLTVTDPLGHNSYLLKPGQHLIFQHGLIQEAIDSSTTSCGCPPEAPKGVSLADAALRAGAGASPTFDQSASAFPFPAAASQGLESPSPLASGEVHLSVAGVLAYDAAVMDPNLALAPAGEETANSGQPVQPPGRRKLPMPPLESLPLPTSPVAVAATHPAPVPAHSSPAPRPPATVAANHPAPAPVRSASVLTQSAVAANHPPAVPPHPVPAPQPPPDPKANQGSHHSLGHFFKKIFGG